MANTPELNEQIELFRFRDLFKHLYPALNWLHSSLNGVHLSPSQRNKAHRSGMTPGIPDVFLPVPMRIGEMRMQGTYHGLYIEMKVGRNDLTPEQEAFFIEARANGYRCEVCRSWIEAANVLMDYLGIEDERLRDHLRVNAKPVNPARKPRKQSMAGSCDAALMMARQENNLMEG